LIFNKRDLRDEGEDYIGEEQEDTLDPDNGNRRRTAREREVGEPSGDARWDLASAYSCTTPEL